MRKKKSIILAAVLAVMGITGNYQTTVFAENTSDLVLMVTSASDQLPLNDMIHEKFDDKYNITSSLWDIGTWEQTLKTTAASGEPLDLMQFTVRLVPNYYRDGLLTPLDSLLSDEFKSRFYDTILPGAAATTEDELYVIPYDTVYPIVIANKDLLDEAGVTLDPINWTWDEFMDACRQIEDKTGAYGAVVNKDWAPWVLRTSLMHIFETDEEELAFQTGQISFKDERVIAGFDQAVEPFKEGLFYPGDGSLAVTLDQAYAAMANERVAFMFTLNNLAVETIDTCELENYVIMDWPTMGNCEIKYNVGSSTGYVIPANAKNIDGALEVLDYLTSEEVMTERVRNGAIVSVKVDTDALDGIDTDLLEAVSRNAPYICPVEILTGSSEMLIKYNDEALVAYYNGDTGILDELEELRIRDFNIE